ncbi:ferredoxin [Devosia pacifica]|uniref:Ferredoxin n=1 Tax=Devosia pacifica TaxID=1335967 RepID=A0A918SDH4_9HYPH|nr:ferredoxin [Devosia pacifica]
MHRGVRLSIGINEGAELKCQYHGWRYANRTAGCTYIPAHPADAPARRITNRTYPVIEFAGLVWSAAGAADAFVEPLQEADWFALRPIPVTATPEMVRDKVVAAAEPGSEPVRLTEFGYSMKLAGGRGEDAAVFIQPVDAGRAVIRALLPETPAQPLATLRHYNALLNALREQIERTAREAPAPEPIEPEYEPVSLELATMPELRLGTRTSIRVRVARKYDAGEGVIGLDLAALEGHLPTFQPGAHIDVHLPNGLVRQYSITNGPGEQLHYGIGVKREPESRGGSSTIAEAVREGDLLAISEPRNNFPLRRDATRTTLIAGGIGITPLLAMAKNLFGSRLEFDFHVFARSQQHLPFADALERFGDHVSPHIGLDAAETGRTLEEIVGSYSFARHLYVCGPAPMLELVRALAARNGWPDEAVHFEYFKNTREIDQSSSFTVELARSALTLEVPAGRTILEVLRENGVEAPSSCEQGACGTCLTKVLEGTPDHQDVYLNETEKQANASMLTCVSRSLSDKLVLDI